jgi:hypothetical protein
MGKHLNPGTRRKGGGGEVKAKKTDGERKVRHQSRVARPKRPVVREGKALNDVEDERAWMDW